MIKNGVFKGWQRAILIVVPLYITIAAFQYIGFIVLGLDPMQINHNKTIHQHFVISFFTMLGTFLVLWIFMKILDNEPFINLGLKMKDRFKDISLGICIGLLIMGFSYIMLFVINEIHFLKINFNAHEILYTFLFFVLVSLSEELLFRGYILRNFMYSFNNYVALILSSILFSLLHGTNPNMDWFSFLTLFFAGVLLGTSYIYSKNLWFPIALHFSWNFFQTLFGFNVSGQDLYSLIQFQTSDENIMNGGDLGFEGSIFSVIVQIILIISLIIYNQKKINKV